MVEYKYKLQIYSDIRPRNKEYVIFREDMYGVE